MNFFERLENLRKKRLENQKEFLAALGVSKTLYHYWKKGERQPSPGYMRRIVEMEKNAGISWSPTYPSAVSAPVGQVQSLKETAGRYPARTGTVVIDISELKSLHEAVRKIEAWIESVEEKAQKNMPGR